HLDVGLSANNVRIEAIAIQGGSESAPTVLLLGGLHGKDETVEVVSREAQAFDAIPQNRRRLRLLAVPLANPEGHTLQFPPAGVAYKENIESHVLWRWIAIHAPDLVVILGSEDEDSGLGAALSQNAVGFVGRVPAKLVAAKSGIIQALPEQIA